MSGSLDTGKHCRPRFASNHTPGVAFDGTHDYLLLPVPASHKMVRPVSMTQDSGLIQVNPLASPV